MEKYLRQYAEPEITALPDLLEALPDLQPWANVMVIPACNESAGFLRSPPPCGGRSLLILVVNEADSASEQVSRTNQALAESVRERFDLNWQSSSEYIGFGLNLFRDSSAPQDILLVDRFSAGRQLPVKGGVGQARKIGVDLAASLIHSKQILSGWIHCTDADVHLPDTYFTCSQAASNSLAGIAALVYPFRHLDVPSQTTSKNVILATQLYELSLRYYVAGMRYAHSPYAFHTIGSTMAVSAHHYAKVRGFPRREAGEDFYLLKKLAKVGSVLDPGIGADCDPVEIEARKSDRVPFGTGAAVIKITDLQDPVRDFRFYDPAVFELLRLWLSSLPAIWSSGSTQLDARMFPGRDQDEVAKSEHETDVMRDSLLSVLKIIKTEQALAHAFRQSKDLAQFTRQMYTWFDAFRTLKLVHGLRDSCLPAISYSTLEAKQTFSDLLFHDQELMAFHKQPGRKPSASPLGS
jgi:hypothetical protein